MEINKKTLRNIFLGVMGCIVLYWLLHETARVQAFLGSILNIVSPFVVGAAIAFVLNVPMRAIERWFKKIPKKGARRALAILVTFTVVILVLVGIVQLLLPQITKTVESLLASLPGFFTRLQEIFMEYLDEHPELLEWLSEYTDFETLDWGSLIEKAISLIGNSLSAVVNTAIATVVSLSTGIFNGILSLVFALYCLSRKEILARQGRRLLYAFLPEKFCDETVRILRMTNATFSNFISGQCLEALILGCMFAITMPIFRMPFVPLVSVIIAVTALVPIVGAFVGCVLGAFFILVQDPMQAVWFVVLFLVLQQIEGNLIYPRVVGTSIGLPGMWVLVAVSVGGNLMGIGGMLLMIPLSAVLYSLAREITNGRLAAKGIDPSKLRDQLPELKSKYKEKRKKSKERREEKKKAEESKEESKEENEEQ